MPVRSILPLSLSASKCIEMTLRSLDHTTAIMHARATKHPAGRFAVLSRLQERAPYPWAERENALLRAAASETGCSVECSPGGRGRATWALPWCWHGTNASSHAPSTPPYQGRCLSSPSVAACSKAGRTEWVMLTPSPGPAAYNPSTQAVMTVGRGWHTGWRLAHCSVR